MTYYLISEYCPHCGVYHTSLLPRVWYTCDNCKKSIMAISTDKGDIIIRPEHDPGDTYPQQSATFTSDVKEFTNEYSWSNAAFDCTYDD